ncbi:hypothetical protein [Hymenobacter volaticus]|uniref:Uncharacterized protein n=1 Tax=Hymenobacter volaticus TaxID=2932254 RepID=A0ABY4GG27_9BACT|nr:hypothetical protein [Hymenobacter volaticus]UOQ69828.1 hypothetical protein MUN86_30460 [Hymenobacter volaticus]
MAISKPPVRKSPDATVPALPVPDEKKIEEVINRGSSQVVTETEAVTIKNFNIKVTAETLKMIDELRAKRPRKPTSPKLGISTQDWLLEAINEKILREQKKYKSGL